MKVKKITNKIINKLIDIIEIVELELKEGNTAVRLLQLMWLFFFAMLFGIAFVLISYYINK